MNFLTISETPDGFIKEVIELAMQLRKENDRTRTDLSGKVLISLYEKPSTRTRLSFETAIANLGGHSIVMDFKSSQLSRGETMADTAHVLSRYGHFISARLFKHTDIVELARHATVPVINALTDREHPCQALADMQTIIEQGKQKGKLVFIGDAANNVAISFMLIASKYGMNVVMCGPKGHLPSVDDIEMAKKSGGTVELSTDPVHAVKDADVIYTDVWVSMGDEAESAKRVEKMKPFQVNEELLEHAKADCIIMHCLPAHRGQEITDAVLEGEHSVVWDQAENRMWAQEALILKLSEGKKEYQTREPERKKEESQEPEQKVEQPREEKKEEKTEEKHEKKENVVRDLLGF